MNRRQRGESLSERLRSEVQVSAALWQIGPTVDENAANGDVKSGSTSRRSTAIATIASTGNGFPCPREVKPLLFFYKYLQPIGADERSGGYAENNGGVSGTTSSYRKLRVNLPLTVVCERTNAQEMVLWLRTDAQGNVVREEKTPLWRKKLHNDLVSVASTTAANSSSTHENDPVLAVRSVARWKSSSNSSGGGAVVLTKRTLDPVIAVPCELPICIQQFVHCRGSQASVYRVFWCGQERKCFAINLTSSLKNTEVPERLETPESSGARVVTTTATLSAMNAAFEAAMSTAAQVSRFYCVTVSPDARACARWPKLRGAAIAEGVQATSRVVEHVQLQLPTMHFHSMTVDFIKDTTGVWWLTRVVDFNASSTIEPPRDEGCFSTRDSAVLIPEALRLKTGQCSEPQLDEGGSPPRESILVHEEAFNNTPNSRICFLCGYSCELTVTFRNELQSMLKAQNADEYKEHTTLPMETPAADEYRMTLTMALDTIFLMRQRGVSLPVWENSVNSVRKSQLRDVCDFPVCTLCYRIYQQQHRLQLIARELHNVLSSVPTNTTDRPELDELTNDSASNGTGVGMATSAANTLATPQLLSIELRCRQEAPKSILTALEAYRTETIPPALLLRGDSPESRPTWSILTPIRGADVDPTAAQLRLVFFFHELQDGGPDLVPTDFFLEYQLGQNVTQVQLEGSKRHTPNRWQLCEARVHYLCATLDAFSEYCSHKRLLIKMKAKPSSPTRNKDAKDLESSKETETGEDGSPNNREGGSPGSKKQGRDKEEFFGYSLLSLRAVITAAKWFGNSLQPESRTDYLLELHTASHGLLTLKLTVGLLVDPVPLGHVRDVLRDRVFLEEQPPRGVYWPPPTHFLGGLAVPRDWIGALMPSEYTKVLPMRRREAPNAHTSVSSPPRHSRISVSSSPSKPITLTRRSSGDLNEKADKSLNSSVIPRACTKRRISNVTLSKDWEQTARKLLSDKFTAEMELTTSDQVQSERRPRSLHLMTVAMIGTTLSRACTAAKRIVFRITEDTATKSFPAVLLATILRYASFANPVSTSCFPHASWSSWKSPAGFHFTRRYSVDRLLAEVKPGSLPMLALLGELLLVLIENRELPSTVDANGLEPLLEPFWQQDSGWRSIPRTQPSCLPERRVIWNRAIRRWEAASGDPTVSEEDLHPVSLSDSIETNVQAAPQSHVVELALEIGNFRSKTLALVLCELFEQMEALDNGYIEIAELRSLAKCLPEDELFCLEEQLDPEFGIRERLSHEDIVGLAQLVEQQRRVAGRTLLHSLMDSVVMVNALARFDRVGYGEMSLQEFRELACEALISQRKVFRGFLEEPKQSQDGFCLRHGFAELYATDSVCVLCASEFQPDKSPGKPTKSPVKTPANLQPTIVANNETNTTMDVVQGAHIEAKTLIGERAATRRNLEIDAFVGAKPEIDLSNARRASSPARLERLRRLSSGKMFLEGVPTEVDREVRPRRRRAIAPGSENTRQMVDGELDSMLDRLHAAERTIVTGEVQVNERKQTVSSTRTRQSSTLSSGAMQHRSSCSDLGNTTMADQSLDLSETCTGQEKVAKAKKRMKKRILKKTARRLRSTHALPTSSSLSKLLRMEFSDRNRTMATSVSESIIEKAVRVEERRKQLDRIVLAEVQEVKRRLAKLLDED